MCYEFHWKSILTIAVVCQIPWKNSKYIEDHSKWWTTTQQYNAKAYYYELCWNDEYEWNLLQRSNSLTNWKLNTISTSLFKCLSLCFHCSVFIITYYSYGSWKPPLKKYFKPLLKYLKADMNSDIPLQTAAIFFLTNFYLKQGIG